MITNLCIGAIVAVAWYLSDSIYLRFVILFIGVMNALYAIWDIFLDGIKYGTEASDVTLMVRILRRKREVCSSSVVVADAKRAGKKAHSTSTLR